MMNDDKVELFKYKKNILKIFFLILDNVGLTLLIVLLSGILFIILCGFLLYKRYATKTTIFFSYSSFLLFSRNDRRIRYLTEMFNSFFPSRPKNVTLNTTDNTDETLNNTMQSKLDISTTTTTNNDEKFTKLNDYDNKFVETPKSKHVNINEKRENQEKQIFIENLKTCPSPYSSYRRTDNKFNSKEQINLNSNIYSQDPLTQKKDDNNSLYEYVDLNQQQQQQPKQEQEVIYDVINPNNERSVQQDTDYDSVMYATPKNA